MAISKSNGTGQSPRGIARLFIALLGIGLMMGLSHPAQAQTSNTRVLTCTSKPSDRDYLSGRLSLEPSEIAQSFVRAIVFGENFTNPDNSWFGRVPVEVPQLWGRYNLGRNTIEEILSGDDLMAGDAAAIERNRDWITFAKQYFDSILLYEELNLSRPEMQELVTERLANRRLPSEFTPEEYRAFMASRQAAQARTGVPPQIAFVQAYWMALIENDQRRGHTGRPFRDINSWDDVFFGDDQIRRLLIRRELNRIWDGDDRAFARYGIYRRIALNCAEYWFRDGISPDVNDTVRRALGWVPLADNHHTFGIMLEDRTVVLSARRNFTTCAVTILGAEADPGRTHYRDVGCDGTFDNVEDPETAAFLQNYRFVPIGDWRADLRGLSPFEANTFVSDFFGANRDRIANLSSNTDRFVVTSTQTYVTYQNNLEIGRSTSESAQGYQGDVMPLIVGEHIIELSVYGYGPNDRHCGYGMLDSSGSGAFDTTLLQVDIAVPTVRFHTFWCDTIPMGVFLGSENLDALSGAIFAREYLQSLNEDAYIFANMAFALADVPLP